MKLGLVCISEVLKARSKIAFKTMTRKSFNSMQRDVAISTLSSRIYHNTVVVNDIITHLAAVGISHYRISSNMFPLVTDPSLSLCIQDLPDIDAIEKNLACAGTNARQHGVSLSCHPDQFNVLASYNPDVVQKSIAELNHQSHVLDLMGCAQDLSSPMCLHLNRAPDFKCETVEQYKARFLANLSNCSAGVQSRLVLENEDKSYWNCRHLYEHFSDVRALVYDNLHDVCNPSYEDGNTVALFRSTWRDYVPVFHWSEGINGSRAHADRASHIPSCVTQNLDCTWEVELKAKDFAILEILNK
jgi:UV DNA damage endonuclease